jgi:hypothetical protein
MRRQGVGRSFTCDCSPQFTIFAFIGASMVALLTICGSQYRLVQITSALLDAQRAASTPEALHLAALAALPDQFVAAIHSSSNAAAAAAAAATQCFDSLLLSEAFLWANETTAAAKKRDFSATMRGALCIEQHTGRVSWFFVQGAARQGLLDTSGDGGRTTPLSHLQIRGPRRAAFGPITAPVPLAFAADAAAAVLSVRDAYDYTLIAVHDGGQLRPAVRDAVLTAPELYYVVIGNGTSTAANNVRLGGELLSAYGVDVPT